MLPGGADHANSGPHTRNNICKTPELSWSHLTNSKPTCCNLEPDTRMPEPQTPRPGGAAWGNFAGKLSKLKTARRARTAPSCTKTQ